MNLHLLFGCKTVTNFLYWSRDGSDPEQRVPGYFDGFVTYMGERTHVYDIVRKRNEAVHAMQGVFLEYDHKAFMLLNLGDIFVNAISRNLIVNSYRDVVSIESENEFLVGCFDKENSAGLYVMNFSRTGKVKSDIKIRLSGSMNIKVWDPKGSTEMHSDEIVLSISPSDAVFVELGG